MDTSDNSFEQRLNKRVMSGDFGRYQPIQKDHYSDIRAAMAGGSGIYRTLGTVSFTGEKNLGEMGPIKNYYVEYDMLRQRSWQLFLESEVAQTVLGKYSTWKIGKGLKLQSEPVNKVLEAASIKMDRKSRQEFCENIEARFALFSKSRMSDYTGMNNLNTLQSVADKNAMVGGDVLVVLRYIKGCVKVQLIDGANVISPIWGSEFYPNVLANGNTIINGIEIAPNGEHIAYYVRKPGQLITWETYRIPARGKKSGLIYAYLLYGSKYRIDNHRGLPLLSVVLETAKKLERYKEATVGSAEERQKIAFFIEHQLGSTGDNPLVNQTMRAMVINPGPHDDIPQDSFGHEVANKVAATTDKATFNLTPGAAIKAIQSKQELYFRDFYEMNIMLFCAAVRIPYEVAMSKYDSNFSASRAALKDWENTLNVGRFIFGNEFMQPIYEFWLETEILKNNIQAPGYIKARQDEDYITVEAYRAARYVGAPVPHIDPLKEVEAERMKLGETGQFMPLTTLEAATEALNGGDSDQNMEQFSEELEMSKELDIVPEPDPILLPTPGPIPGQPKKKKKKSGE